MYGKSQITLFQIFFLSLAYAFSGLFLLREASFLSLLLPLAVGFFYCAIGYLFLRCAPMDFSGQGRWIGFLSCGKAHIGARIFAAFFSVLCAAELLASVIAFAVSVSGFSDFLSVSFSAAMILLCGVFVGVRGLTAVGRFSELLAFPILPLVFWIIFWDFAPVDFRAFSDDLHALLAVTPAPLLYLFSMTALQSTAVPKPNAHRLSVVASAFSGIAAAALCVFLFLLYGAKENNLFLLFFGWTASLIRLALLICVCTEERKRQDLII